MKRKCKTLLMFVLVLTMLLSVAQTALAKTYYSIPFEFSGRVQTVTETPDDGETGEQPDGGETGEQPEAGDPAEQPDAGDTGEQPDNPEQTAEPEIDPEQPLPEDSETSPEIPVSYTATVSAVDGAPVYAQPDEASSILADLMNGARVTVIGEVEAWAHVDAEGLLGYVPMSLLSADAQEPEQPAPEAVTAFLTLEAPAVPTFGDQVTITCHVSGVTDEDRVVWQRALTDSEGNILSDWTDVESDALTRTMELTPESLCTAWRVRIDTPDIR